MTDADPPDHTVVISVVYDGPPRAQDDERARGTVAELTPAGDVTAGGRDWLIHSNAAAVFGDLEEARTVLIEWARRHAVAQAALSRRRCIVVAATGDGTWRLWQIVHRQPPLRDLAGIASDRAERMVAEVGALCAAIRLPLPCTLATVGTDADRAVYVGLMPPIARRVERA